MLIKKHRPGIYHKKRCLMKQFCTDFLWHIVLLQLTVNSNSTHHSNKLQQLLQHSFSKKEDSIDRHQTCMYIPSTRVLLLASCDREESSIHTMLHHHNTTRHVTIPEVLVYFPICCLKIVLRTQHQPVSENLVLRGGKCPVIFPLLVPDFLKQFDVGMSKQSSNNR